MKNVAGSWELGGGEVGSRHWQGRRQVTIDFSSHSLVTTVSKDAAQALFALQLFFDDVKSMAIQDDSSIGSNVTQILDLTKTEGFLFVSTLFRYLLLTLLCLTSGCNVHFCEPYSIVVGTKLPM